MNNPADCEITLAVHNEIKFTIICMENIFQLKFCEAKFLPYLFTITYYILLTKNPGCAA
jgi:hypothetical protein